MKKETRYRYQQQIKASQDLLNRATEEKYCHRAAVTEIYDELVISISNGRSEINAAVILRKIKRCIK